MISIRYLLSFVLCNIGFVGAQIVPSTGRIPLTDLGGEQYEGFAGGLYPDGNNEPPLAHSAAGVSMAAQIVPRNAAGNPDPNGWIGLVTVGMSNTAQEFAAFERQEDLNSERNPRIVLVNTAYNGTTAAGIKSPSSSYWSIVNSRLAAMGLTPQQVQVVWLKQINVRQPDNFPIHAQQLRDDLTTLVRTIHDLYPNVRLCYVDSRIYGGFSLTDRSPEPHAYETAFSVKWLIENQINGSPLLNFNAQNGIVEAPLLLWGPYLWADGVIPRSDGLTWTAVDFQDSDGVHLTDSGRQKVVDLLAGFVTTNASAEPWYLETSQESLAHVDAAADAMVKSAQSNANFGTSTVLYAKGGGQVERTYVRFNLSSIPRPVKRAKLSLLIDKGGGGRVSLVNNTTWSETGITYANAPAVGSLIATIPEAHRLGTIAVDVTNTVNADADGVVTFAITETANTRRSYMSRESGEPPRLILVLPGTP